MLRADGNPNRNDSGDLTGPTTRQPKMLTLKGTTRTTATSTTNATLTDHWRQRHTLPCVSPMLRFMRMCGADHRVHRHGRPFHLILTSLHLVATPWHYEEEPRNFSNPLVSKETSIL